jgi:uncharacterized repeat protein (TIGR03803 family)
MTNSLQRVVPMVRAIVLVSAALAQAQQHFTVLYNFTGGQDGAWPFAGVIQDPAGNLYGTTYEGGTGGYGVVFRLDTAGTESVLHSLAGPSSDGSYPVTAVVRDTKGNFYGTSIYGGSYDHGTVVKINAAGHEKVLYSFSGGSDGCYPQQGLIMDKAGTLYGSTDACGSSGNGTIFKVDRAGNFTLLHSFTRGWLDGANPQFGHLTMDISGNLYGVTELGGANDAGVLYELSKKGKLTVLHSFGGANDGCYPFGSVVQDKAGNAYGITQYCGSGWGTIWKVSKKGKETILHSFAGGTSDGCNPFAGVTLDAKGNLYGVAAGCGDNNWGVLYELSAHRRFSLLHRFDSSGAAYPVGEVLRTAKGGLFGTTEYGGYAGAVWKYAP